MNPGARIVLALTAGALAGSIAIAVSTRNELVDDGAKLAVPLAGTITIHPQIDASPQTLATGVGVALAFVVLAFIVAGV